VAQPDAADIDYDPIDHEIDANAHAVWRRMRDEAPLYRNDEYDFWAPSRYDDVLPAMLDTETYSSASGTTIELLSTEMFDFLLDYGSVIPPTMILALLGFPEGFEREWRDSVNAGLTVAPDSTHADRPATARATAWRR